MKLPEMKSRHRIRDTKICELRSKQSMSSDEIAEWLISGHHYFGTGKFESVASIVRKVLYRNKVSLEIDKNYEKFNQIIRIKRQIAKKGDSEKDVADLEKLLHEIMNEPYKTNIDQSHHTHYTVVWEIDGKENKISPAPIAGRNLAEPSKV